MWDIWIPCVISRKRLRRAELPVAFSGGYSPHMIMSFAVPLGVGMESLGDYFDLEMAEDMPTCRDRSPSGGTDGRGDAYR